jgi:hypothetical protein
VLRGADCFGAIGTLFVMVAAASVGWLSFADERADGSPRKPVAERRLDGVS